MTRATDSASTEKVLIGGMRDCITVLLDSGSKHNYNPTLCCRAPLFSRVLLISVLRGRLKDISSVHGFYVRGCLCLLEVVIPFTQVLPKVYPRR